MPHEPTSQFSKGLGGAGCEEIITASAVSQLEGKEKNWGKKRKKKAAAFVFRLEELKEGNEPLFAENC